MHVRAIVCTVLYDGRALTTVARLHRMNIKYKRYRSRRGKGWFSASLSFRASPRPCISSWDRPRALHAEWKGPGTENNCHYHCIGL